MAATPINTSFSSVQFSSFDITLNFNGGGGAIGNDLLARLDKIEKALGLSSETPATTGLTNHFRTPGTGGGCFPAPVELPVIEDGDQPAGSLKAEGNKITTAGGYTVEVLGTSEWKITGPDGKSTRIWGDPHVHEDDGGTGEGSGGWDFKRNSTFVLGDGTKINVTTVPGGAAGATVTGGLEIISGNDRITVNDMEKGMGKISDVTKDGYARTNSFQGDVFVMGKESDDWSFNGKEIIGSEGMGEKFKLGNDLPTGPQVRNSNGATNSNAQLDRLTQRFDNLRDVFARTLLNFFNRAFQPNNLGLLPYAGNKTSTAETNKPISRTQYRQNVTQNFRDLAKMFSVLGQLSNLSDRISDLRFRSNANV